MKWIPVRIKYTALRLLMRVLRRQTPITCSGRHDGGGAQLHGCLSTLLFAQDFGLKYCHSPLAVVDHRPIDASSDNWAEQWNSCFLSLPIKAELHPLPQQHQIEHCHSLLQVLKAALFRGRSNVIYAMPHAHSYCELFPDRFHKIINKVKPVSGSAAKRQILVAHVRRGDVQASNSNANRYTASESVLATIAQITSHKPADFVEIIVFSNEYCSILANAALPHYRFDCTSSVFDILAAMISADTLLMAKSSLSYVAALFCSGQIYYQPFWHNPQSHWHNL